MPPHTTTPGGTTETGEGVQLTLPPPPAGRGGQGTGTGEPSEPPKQKIDVAQFIRPDVDFIELQLRNATELAQITYGLLKLRTEEGDPGAIAAASKNWHETSKAAADVIEKFTAAREKAGTLVPIDAIEDIIATELEEIRKGLKRLGRRVGPIANPENPALAEKAIDAAVDRILEAFNNLADRARIELAEKLEEDRANAPHSPPAASPPADSESC